MAVLLKLSKSVSRQRKSTETVPRQDARQDSDFKSNSAQKQDTQKENDQQLELA